MAESNPKKRKKNSKIEVESDLLRSDIASFASSIGLALQVPSSLPDSGFNDSDFRKRGPLNPKSDKPRRSDLSNEIPRDKNKKSQESIAKNKNRATVYASKKEKVVKNSGKLTNLFSESEKQIDGSKTVRKDGKTKLPLMKPITLSGEWFVDALELERKVLGVEGKVIDVNVLKEWSYLVEKKVKVAEGLMEQYSSEYEVSTGKDADKRIALVAKRSGTAADKVAAFTTLVGDNPIANLRSLDALLGMVTSNVGKRHALTGFDALKELFLLRLLPDRKLKQFKHRPLNHLPETKDGFSLLLFWYWEDCLKKRFERFIIALEEASKDALPILKDKSFKTMYQLLTSKPEQERRLLSALVNKLGDPERKTASGAEYHLSCLLSAHPNMKAVVIEEVDRFLLRKHLGLRAKYHAINFLSHIFLSKKGDGPKIAKHLVIIYFGLFKVLISEADNEQGGKDGKQAHKKVPNSFQKSKEESPGSNVEMDSRLLSALLTGVNRAFPFVATDEADEIIELQTPILFKLVHSKNFNVGVQALMLLYQISSKNEIASDRFYRALYSKLLVPAAMKSSKPEMFLGLLFKAMKNDLKLKRICAFSKRLLQVALQQPPQYACGCLFILSEVLKARPHLRETMLQSESVEEDFEHFEDIIEDSQTVVDTAATKSETSIGFGSVGARNDSVRTETILSDSDSDEELTNSYSEEGNNSEEEDRLLRAAMGNNSLLDKGRSLTVSDGEREQVQNPKSSLSLPGGYDPRHREPSFCNADHASWVELMVLASHVHPSVATMARKLLNGDSIIYDGDPLIDLSLSAFLDKFVERKPKPNRRADGVWYGGSQIAPAKKLEMSKTLIGPEILSLAEEDVRPEDLIFHKFYMNKNSSSRKKKKKKAKDGDEDAEELYQVDREDDGEGEDDEGVDDDVDDVEENDEEEIDNILGAGPQEDDGDYDYDDLDEVLNNDDDEELLGNDSDADVDSQHGDGDDVDDDMGFSDDGMEDDLDFVGGGDDDDDEGGLKKKKQKLKGKFGASPFASIDEFEHLLNEDGKTKGKKSKNKSRKKSG